MFSFSLRLLKSRSYYCFPFLSFLTLWCYFTTFSHLLHWWYWYFWCCIPVTAGIYGYGTVQDFFCISLSLPFPHYLVWEKDNSLELGRSHSLNFLLHFVLRDLFFKRWIWHAGPLQLPVLLSFIFISQDCLSFLCFFLFFFFFLLYFLIILYFYSFSHPSSLLPSLPSSLPPHPPLHFLLFTLSSPFIFIFFSAIFSTHDTHSI